VDLEDTEYADDKIYRDSDSMLFRLVVSTVPKWRIFKLLSCLQVLNRLLDLDENVYEGDNIDNGSDSMLFRLLYSKMPKWRTFKILRSLKLLNRLVY
jgi:hypothetical protein